MRSHCSAMDASSAFAARFTVERVERAGGPHGADGAVLIYHLRLRSDAEEGEHEGDGDGEGLSSAAVQAACRGDIRALKRELARG